MHVSISYGKSFAQAFGQSVVVLCFVGGMVCASSADPSAFFIHQHFWSPSGVQQTAWDLDTNEDGSLSIAAYGDGLTPYTDEGLFIHSPVSDSWTVTVRLRWPIAGGSIQGPNVALLLAPSVNTQHNAQYGIEARTHDETASLTLHGVWRENSTSALSESQPLETIPATTPVWLRMTYREEIGMALCEFSVDGETWVFVHGKPIAQSTSLSVGLLIANTDTLDTESVVIEDARIDEAIPDSLKTIIQAFHAPDETNEKQSIGVFSDAIELGGLQALPNQTSLNNRANVSASYAADSDEYTLTASGGAFQAASDEGIFLHDVREGAWSIRGQVANIQTTDGKPVVALSIREQAGVPSSPHFSVGATLIRDEPPTGHGLVATRFADSTHNPWINTGALSFDETNTVAYPYRKITYYPDLALAQSFRSEDGVEWLPVREQQIKLQGPIAYGIFLSHGNPDEGSSEAILREVRMEPAPPIAQRSITPAFYAPGETITVSLSIHNPAETETSVQWTEHLPQGWSVSADPPGTFDSTALTYSHTVLAQPGTTEVSYTILAGNEPGQFHGTLNGNPIRGEQVIAQSMNELRAPVRTQWRNWNHDDGFEIGQTGRTPNLSVTPNGTLWIRSDDQQGIIEFDGYIFTLHKIPRELYPPNTQSTLGKSETPILMRTPDHTRWAFDFRNGFLHSIVRYMAADWQRIDTGLHASHSFLARSIAPLNQNEVLILHSQSDTLALVDLESMTSAPVEAESLDAIAPIHVMHPSPSGSIWLAGERGLARIIVHETNIGWEFDSAHWLIEDEWIDTTQRFTKVVEQNDGQIGLQRFSEAERAYTPGIRLNPKTGEWKQSNSEFILSFDDAYGSEWGINQDQQISRMYRTDEGAIEKYTLISDTVVELASDPTHKTWVLTDNGLYRENPSLWNVLPQLSGLNEPVFAIDFDEENTLWGLSKTSIVQVRGDESTLYPLPPDVVIPDAPGTSPTMLIQPDGTLLLCGVLLDPKQTDRIPDAVVFSPEPQSFERIPSNGMGFSRAAHSPTGNSVIRTPMGAFLEMTNSGPTPFQTIRQTSQEEAYAPFLVLRSGELLFVQQDGIYIQPQSAGQTSDNTPDSNGSIRVFQRMNDLGTVHTLYEAEDGSVWLGAERGLFHFKDETMTDVLTSAGSVQSVLEAKDGSIWFASDTGVYHQSGKDWLHYSTEDGLPHRSVLSLHEDDTGRIWAGTTRGLARYDTTVDQDPPETTIPDRHFSVPPNESIVIPFAGVDRWKTTASEDLRFSVRVNGGEWSTFEQQSPFAMRRLPPGTFTLDVRAMDLSGNIDPTPASTRFIIQQPWYMRPAYIIWMITGILTLGLLLYYSITRHFKLQEAFIQLHQTNSELTETQQALEEAKVNAESATEAKSHFLAKMSHEIRTPLNGIIGNIELLSFTRPDPKQFDLLRSANLSAQTLLSLIGDVLDFAKIEANRIEIMQEHISLRSIIEEVFSMMCVRANQQSLRMVAWIDPSLPDIVVGDELRIRQVIINLLGNSLKFTKEGGVFLNVFVDTNSDELARIRVDVIDTGEGFDLEDSDSLFEEFTQDQHRNRDIEGTGLGLAICKRIVTLMGGSIYCEGARGKGAHFSFTLECPIVSPASEQALPDTTSVQVVHQSVPALRNRVLHALEPIAAETTEQVYQPGSSVTLPEKYGYLVALHTEHAPDVLLHCGTIPERTIRLLITESEKIETRWAAYQQGFDFVCSACDAERRIPSLIDSRAYMTLHQADITGWEMDLLEEQSSIPALKSDLPILVIDDTAANRMLALNQLSQLGLSCEVAEHGLEGLHKAQQKTYALIFADCSMPVMDGFEFTRELREWEKQHNRHTPIIAMTAHAVAGDRERCLQNGMDDYLTKPVLLTKLRSMLSEWLPQSEFTEESTETNEITRTDIPIQVDLFIDQYGLDQEDIPEILEAYIEDMDRIIEQMHEAFRTEDRTQVRDAAHAAKSASYSSAAMRLGDQFDRIEQNAANAEWPTLQNLFNDTLPVYEETHQFIETLHPRSS